MEFPVYKEYPAIIWLSVHLKDKQSVYFLNDIIFEQLQKLIERKSKLMIWFEYNCEHFNNRKIIYADFSKCYTFCKDRWKLRQLGNIIGCIYYVPPISNKIYYL